MEGKVWNIYVSNLYCFGIYFKDDYKEENLGIEILVLIS